MKMKLLICQIISALALVHVAQATTIGIAATGITSIPLQNYASVSGMCNDANGLPFDLGCISSAGAYVVYSINVAQAGNYALSVFYSSPLGNTGANILVNGVNSGSVSFTSTGSWTSYTNAAPIVLALPAGTVSLEIQAQEPGFNIGGLSLSPSATGTIQISLQNYSSVSGMCNDANGLSFDLGCIASAGADVVYSINVAQAGNYALTVFYSSPTGNTGANILVNGVGAGSVSFTSTGSWTSYTNAAPVILALPAGSASLEIQAQEPGFNIGGLSLSPSATGTIQISVQNYSVISGMCNDANGLPFDLGCVNPGGYVIYTINVAQAGNYALTVFYSSPNGNMGANILVNGVDTGSVNFSSTGSWTAYTNAAPIVLALPAGTVSLEIQAQEPGFNIGGLSLSPSATGTIQISIQNYSSISGMCNDANGLPFDLGCIAGAGANVVFSIKVAQAGNYALTVFYSSPTGNTGANILVNGVNYGSVSFASTGSWTSYTNAAPIVLALPAGTVSLEIQAQQPGFNIGGLSLIPSAPSATPTGSTPPTGTIQIPLQNYSAISGICNDANGLPLDLGCITSAGAYVAYSINVAQAGNYALTLFYSSPLGNTGANILVNGVETGSVSFASTSSWSSYIYAAPIVLALPTGTVSLEIQAQESGFNLGGLSLVPASVNSQPGTFGSLANPVVATVAPPTTSAVPASYFGMTIQNLTEPITTGGSMGLTPFPSLPIQTLRLWDVTYWQQLEPVQGQYNWTNMDGTIALGKENGVSDFIFTLGHVPPWASSDPSDSSCSEGAGTCDAPNMPAFDAFLTQVVQRYCGVVKYYETWNEPDSTGFWNGTDAQLLSVANDTYQIAKNPANCGCQNGVCSPGGGVNPNQVILPPVSSLGRSSMNWLGGYLGAAGSSYPYADIAAFHGYDYTTPEGIIGGVNTFQQTIAQYGLGNVPIWNTEANWGLHSTNSAQAEEAAWLMRYYAAQATTGVSRFIWYSYDNCAWGTLWGPACGSSGNLLDNWVGIRSAGIAYGVIANWLVGNSLNHCEQYQDGLWACELQGPEDYTGWILWNATGSNVTVSISGELGLTDYRNWENDVNSLPATLNVGSMPVLLEN